MRFSLFGRGEGLHSECDASLWASVCGGEVSDASISARKLGVRPGMALKTAQALAMQLVVCEPSEGPTPSMERIWRKLWERTPWIETVDDDAFFLQLPGRAIPLRETRDLLRTIDVSLSNEQRIRVGMAENPFLARALVEWSLHEPVRGAVYRRVGRQQLILSPGCADVLHQGPLAVHSLCTDWLSQMPIAALWWMPMSVRQSLADLGVYRLGQLSSIPDAQLKRRFGRESLLWKQVLNQKPGGTIDVNYPPIQYTRSWRADIGEGVAAERVSEVVTPMVDSLARELEESGLGVLVVGLRWRSGSHEEVYERAGQRPLFRAASLLARIRPGYPVTSESPIDFLEVYGAKVRPLATVQSAFTVAGGMLLPGENVERSTLQRVLSQVNHRFPHALQVGKCPDFREMRWQLVSQ